MASEGVPARSDRERIDPFLVASGSGDRVAFGRLYDEVASLVFGIALRVVRDHARAEEISQEVFIQVWRKAPRFDPARGSAKAWVATIAHRRAVDVVRREQSRRDREAASAGATSGIDHATPAAIVEANLEREGVAAALGSLTELQREAIHLAFYEGRTYREVAQLLDVPLGTIKTRMRDGLKRLAAALGVDDG